MDNSLVSLLLLQLILIALNAIFACAEIAVISINDSKLARMAAEGDRRAARLARLNSRPARFLATIQVAITLSGFLGAAFAAENFSDRLVDWLIGLGVSIPRATLDVAAVVLITILLSYFTLVFGELVPKRVAVRKAEALALGMSGMISFVSKVFAPFVWLLTASTNGILRLMDIDPNAEDEEVSEEEIRMMVDVGSEKGTIDSEEKEFIQNVFEFDDLTAGEIVTHRTDIISLWMDESMEEWGKTIHESRYTRYPVCEESADHVIGILNAKDYFRLEDKSRESVMEHAVRAPYFVPDSVKADVLFKNMKRDRNPVAVVLDEYGGVRGIVTMNDLVEQLVGDLGEDDEAQENLPLPIEKIGENTWRIQGFAEVDEIERELNVKFPVDEYETFNGLVLGQFSSVPHDGAKPELTLASLDIRVEDIRSHQVSSAIVTKRIEEEED